MLAGGALVARAVRSGRRGRAVTQGVLGAGLIALGLRQRLSRDGSPGTEHDSIEFEDHDGSPTGETTTTEDLVQDPRMDEAPDADSDDSSESATAAEPAEAAGPEPEQSLPTQTEATEPEESPEEDAPNVQADELGGSGAIDPDSGGSGERASGIASDPGESGVETADGAEMGAADPPEPTSTDEVEADGDDEVESDVDDEVEFAAGDEAETGKDDAGTVEFGTDDEDDSEQDEEH